MDPQKKFLPVIKVGGRRVVKKPSTGKENVLKTICDSNKKSFSRSAIDELVLEKGSKLYKYKGNIKIVLDSSNSPIGILVAGSPEVKNKIILDVPEDFEKAVEKLNESNELSELDLALNID